MKHRSTKLLTLALATSLGVACARTPSPSNPSAVATIASASGDVVIKRAGTDAWIPATEGARLAAQDRLWVRTGSAEIREDSGETQRLSDNTVTELR